MNYFILNNNFHLNYIKKNLKEKLENSILLVNKHNIDEQLFRNYKSIFFINPIQTYYDITRIRKFRKVYYDIIHSLELDSEYDTLYVCSEQDFLNLHIINFFYRSNINVVLLEDGTFTPLYLTIENNHIIFKYLHSYIINCLFFFFLKYIINIENIQMNFQYNTPVFRLKDSIYSKILLSSNFNLQRNIKEELLPQGLFNLLDIPLKLNQNNIAIFANSPHNLEIGNKYFEILKTAVYNFWKEYSCDKIIFCFHPRDSEENILKIKLALSEFKFVEFENQLSTSEVVKMIMPKYLVSFMSTGLFEFRPYSENVIFLINKYPEVIFPAIAEKMMEFVEINEICKYD